MLERLQVCDAHRVGGNRPRSRPTPGSNSDTVGPCPPREVSDDEVIAGEPLRRNDADFVSGALTDLVREVVAVSFLDARPHGTFERLLFRVSRVDREVRHVVCGRVKRDVAPFRNEQRVVCRFGVIGKQRSHFGS